MTIVVADVALSDPPRADGSSPSLSLKHWYGGDRFVFFFVYVGESGFNSVSEIPVFGDT